MFKKESIFARKKPLQLAIIHIALGEKRAFLEWANIGKHGSKAKGCGPEFKRVWPLFHLIITKWTEGYEDEIIARIELICS